MTVYGYVTNYSVVVPLCMIIKCSSMYDTEVITILFELSRPGARTCISFLLVFFEIGSFQVWIRKLVSFLSFLFLSYIVIHCFSLCLTAAAVVVFHEFN